MLKPPLTKEEVQFLARCHQKLRANKTFCTLSHQYHSYISEFIDKELLAIKKARRKYE